MLSFAGRFTHSWKPRMRPSSCSGISECTRPRPAVIHCTLPGTSRPSLPWLRSEEHTSELPSLMRTSYAAFCLNTKNQYLYASLPAAQPPHHPEKHNPDTVC